MTENLLCSRNEECIPLSHACQKNKISFPFKFNGIWTRWQFSFWFWTGWNLFWFNIERKTIITVIFHRIWKEMNYIFLICICHRIYIYMYIHIPCSHIPKIFYYFFYIMSWEAALKMISYSWSCYYIDITHQKLYPISYFRLENRPILCLFCIYNFK